MLQPIDQNRKRNANTVNRVSPPFNQPNKKRSIARNNTSKRDIIIIDDNDVKNLNNSPSPRVRDYADCGSPDKLTTRFHSQPFNQADMLHIDGSTSHTSKKQTFPIIQITPLPHSHNQSAEHSLDPLKMISFDQVAIVMNNQSLQHLSKEQCVQYLANASIVLNESINQTVGSPSQDSDISIDLCKLVQTIKHMHKTMNQSNDKIKILTFVDQENNRKIKQAKQENASILKSMEAADILQSLNQLAQTRPVHGTSESLSRSKLDHSEDQTINQFKNEVQELKRVEMSKEKRINQLKKVNEALISDNRQKDRTIVQLSQALIEQRQSTAALKTTADLNQITDHVDLQLTESTAQPDALSTTLARPRSISEVNHLHSPKQSKHESRSAKVSTTVDRHRDVSEMRRYGWDAHAGASTSEVVTMWLKTEVGMRLLTATGKIRFNAVSECHLVQFAAQHRNYDSIVDLKREVICLIKHQQSSHTLVNQQYQANSHTVEC